MATDFLHTQELIEAVDSVLRGSGSAHTGGLPSTWFQAGHREYLKLLEPGDLADHAKTVLDDLPAIVIRGLGPRSDPRTYSGGVIETQEIIRVTHVRAFSQCWTSSGGEERNMTSARNRYAKIIGKALFNDPNKKLAVIDAASARTEVSLTCADSAGAQLIWARFAGWDLGYEIGNPNSTEDVQTIRDLGIDVWAIACDLLCTVRSGGNG